MYCSHINYIVEMFYVINVIGYIDENTNKKV